jgi:hypothetical protein
LKWKHPPIHMSKFLPLFCSIQIVTSLQYTLIWRCYKSCMGGMWKGSINSLVLHWKFFSFSPINNKNNFP